MGTQRWHSFGPTLAACAVGALAALSVDALLMRLAFAGRAHSFDALLYARSLWGVAHGDFFNPVVGTPIFGIHGQLLGLFALAPLARVAPAAAVLALAQAGALGVSLAIAGTEAARIARAAGDRRSGAVGVLFGLALFLGTPLLTNPFLFDLRPDLLALPFLVWGFARIARAGLDRRAAIAMLPAILCREEFAFVVGWAALVAPSTLPRRTRAIYAAGVAAYGLAYVFLVRPALAGADESLASHLAAASTLSPIALTRATQTLLFFAGAGGLVLAARRTLWLAVPGALFLAGSSWMPEHQLSFHYSMFLAPAIVAAGLEGLQSVESFTPPRRLAAIGAIALFTTASFATGSALPGGGRFAGRRFDLVDDQFALRLDGRVHDPNVLAAHALVAAIPEDEGLAITSDYGARAADRAVVLSLRRARRALARGRSSELARVDAVVLGASDVDALGPRLVAEEGFRLEAQAGEVTLLRRRTGDARADALFFRPSDNGCDAPLARWDELGLVLCRARHLSDGAVALIFVRRCALAGAADGACPDRAAIALVDAPDEPGTESTGTGPTGWVRADVSLGLVPLSQAPPGVPVAAFSVRAFAAPSGRVAIVDEDGHPIARRVAGGTTEEPLEVRWDR